MNAIISIVAVGLYLSASFLIFKRLRRLAGGVNTTKPVLLSLWGAAIPFHLLILYQHLVTPAGLNLAFFTALSTVAILITIVLFLSTIKQPMENLGIVVLPFAALSILLETFSQTGTISSPSADHALKIHILISLLAYSILSLAVLQAGLLAIQDSRLHKHQPGGFIRALPPLQLMEKLLFQLIGLGFVLLSLALISGFLFLEDIFSQHLVHKTVLSMIAWGVFALLLWGRWRFGWRGRKAMHWTLGGFFFLMLAYFGSKLVLELVLQRV